MYNLLIADDEQIVRKGIKTLVDYSALEIGEVYEAENGAQALEMVKSGKIHIVFADINMPRLNGLDFAKKVREFDKSVKIALITGYDYFDYVLTALKIGVDDYILKPVSKDDVTELLIKLIEKRKTADGMSSVMKSADRITKLSGFSDDDSLKKVLKDKIDQHIADSEFCLSKLAEELGYNTAYLSTLFKKYFGVNFRDYLMDMRLERAKILLLSTQMKSYEVAAAIGIEDANYLSTCFKKKFGVTVSDYRRTGGRP
jgi:two-component system response regulator YesN